MGDVLMYEGLQTIGYWEAYSEEMVTKAMGVGPLYWSVERSVPFQLSRF